MIHPLNTKGIGVETLNVLIFCKIMGLQLNISENKGKREVREERDCMYDIYIYMCIYITIIITLKVEFRTKKKQIEYSPIR